MAKSIHERVRAQLEKKARDEKRAEDNKRATVSRAAERRDIAIEARIQARIDSGEAEFDLDTFDYLDSSELGLAAFNPPNHAKLVKRARQIIYRATAANLTIDAGNVVDLLADNMTLLPLSEIRSIAAACGFAVSS